MKTMKFHFSKAMGNCGASKFFRSISLGVMLTASHSTLADAELDRMKNEISKEAYVEVLTAPSVKEQISKLPIAKKKQVKAAIKVGAAYMKVYLHGTSSCDPTDLWDAYMRGLTATDDAHDWYNNFCGGDSGYDRQAVQPLACFPVLLAAVQLNNGGILLAYQITRLGGFVSGKDGIATEFKSLGVGETRRFKVVINANNRIADIAPRGDPAEISYVRVVEFLKRSLSPRNLLGDSTEEVEAKKVQRSKLIQQIEQQAAQICK